MNLQQRKIKMANARRSDYGEEFVERLRKDRFRKAYILVNGLSSGDDDEDEEELCFEDEDDEIVSVSYALDHTRRPPSVHSSRRPPSVSHSQRAGGAFGFDARDLYFFGVLSELSDKFTPEGTARLITKNPPPADFRSLGSIERVAYLLYFSLYGKYLSVGKFHNVFNREFFKYTSAGDSERVAFLKICRITLEEYKRRAIEHNKKAYKLSQKHLFSDGRASPDSRLSDRPSMESEDINSIDSLAKELMFYRAPHAPVRFGRGGKIIYVDPTRSVSTVSVEDMKHFFRDVEGRKYVEILESFKGPLLVGHTPPQTPLLFIQCQINRLLQSDVYRANPSSSDANDCLLIWSLLEMLIRQHGKVTGPDLARLLCSNQPNYLATLHKSFLKKDAEFVRCAPGFSRQDSADVELISDGVSSALDRMTNFLLGGHIDEAIDSAMSDDLLFDALLLAHRLFGNDRDRLDAVEARLMARRSPQHPITTLLSVAANQPVPLLTNPTSYETNGWRSHIAIVLANLQSPTAMNAVYQLGLALAHKEFNSAADFCFLAVNLLSGFDCFHQKQHEKDEKHRQSIRLISATLPDDESNSFHSRFGWSILDYQATELFDFALQLANPNSPTPLSKSSHYAKARLQYAQLLDELGGFKNAVELYRTGSGGGGYGSDGSEETLMSAANPAQSMQNKAILRQQQRLVQRHDMGQSSIDDNNDHRAGVDVLLPGGGEVEEMDDRMMIMAMEGARQGGGTTLGFGRSEEVGIPEALVPPEQNKNVIKQESTDSSDNCLPIQPDRPLGSFVENLDLGQVVSRQTIGSAQLGQLPAAPSSESNMQAKGLTALKQSTKTVPAGGKGFLSGFLSKIKPPSETNEMKLPEDKDPKIIWDSQLGRYVDQEQEQQPREELAPPPIIPTYQPQPWQQVIQPTEQQQRPPAQAMSRAFQGKPRYANAWNS